jgi:hypothetical protein
MKEFLDGLIFGFGPIVLFCAGCMAIAFVLPFVIACLAGCIVGIAAYGIILLLFGGW